MDARALVHYPTEAAASRTRVFTRSAIVRSYRLHCYIRFTSHSPLRGWRPKLAKRFTDLRTLALWHSGCTAHVFHSAPRVVVRLHHMRARPITVSEPNACFFYVLPPRRFLGQRFFSVPWRIPSNRLSCTKQLIILYSQWLHLLYSLCRWKDVIPFIKFTCCQQRHVNAHRNCSDSRS